MKIKIMTSDAIEYIKKNINKLVHYYVDGESPEIWLKKRYFYNFYLQQKPPPQLRAVVLSFPIQPSDSQML